MTSGTQADPEQAVPLGRPALATDRSALAALARRLSEPEFSDGPEDRWPEAELAVLRGTPFWLAGLPPDRGGPLLPAGDLLRLMHVVGRASLPLARLFEGHVNALLLVSLYGTPGQVSRAARDAQAGHLFGVWNTEGPDGVRLLPDGPASGVPRLEGAKTFASGGRNVTRPLLPVESEAGRQLVLLRADAPGSEVREVPGSWRPLGMAATHSVKLDFSGSLLEAGDLIGQPGDYYRQPTFSAGALRFCAAQQGGAERLLAEVRAYLSRLGRSHDDVQLLRFADAWLGLQAARLSLAEGERLEREHSPGQGSEAQAGEARLLAQVDAVRLATENACLTLLEACERAVGARGLLEPEPFSRLIRDLRMYLRQPAPDAARLRLGRWVMEGGSLPEEETGLPAETEPPAGGPGI